MKYLKYLTMKEEEDQAFEKKDEVPSDDDDGLSPDNAMKVILLSDIMDMKKQMPVMRKTVTKVLTGKPLGEKERSMLKVIMGYFFRPEKSKFRRLLKKF